MEEPVTQPPGNPAADAGRPLERTWDGLPVSPEPPFGVTVVVYRRSTRGGQPVLEFLILHRGHQGPDFEGDWAWGPPAGARLPGEDIRDCARRELREETGLELEPVPVSDLQGNWAVFRVEAPPAARVRLSAEHDRSLWVPVHEAVARCRPALVADQIRAVARIVSGE